MKNINEELNHIKYLFGYKKGKVLSEQEYPVTTEDTTDDPNYVTKSKNLKIKGPGKDFNWIGKQRSPGELNLNFRYSKQIDKGLDTVGDVLQKMSLECAGGGFDSLPADYKTKLAEGYFNAIEQFANNVKVTGYEGKLKRRLKKFFKKSQKWKFSIVDLTAENMSGKIKATKLDKLDIDMPASTDPTLLAEFQEMVDTSLDVMLENNTKPEIILGTEASLFRFLDSDEITETEVSEVLPFNKNRLQTFYGYVSQKIDRKERTPELEESYTTDQNIQTSPIPLSYPAGASDPSSYMTGIMNTIYNEIYKKSVNYNSPDGQKTLTIKEMLDCGQNRCAERFEVMITSIKAIGSSSNSWTGKDILDFTHTNDGEKVKEVSELKNEPNNVKNLKLAKKRADLLLSAVISEFNQNPIFIQNLDLGTNSSTEYRITDTGGKYDNPSDTTRKPGQYAQFEISLQIVVRGKKTTPGVDMFTGQITQKIIQLDWVGGRGGWSMDWSFIPSTTTKSVYFRKNGKRLPKWFSDFRYNLQQKKWGNSERRSIFTKKVRR